MPSQPREFQRKCRCGRPFATDQPHRTKCFNCSPARLKPANSDPIPFTPVPAVQPPPTSPAGEEPKAPGATERRVTEQLESMGLLDTWRAELALGLARDLDSPEVIGAPRTSMTKQLFTMMLEFEGKTPPEADDLDDFMGAADRLRGNA